MGERRWRAAQQAGLATIPAIVRETADDSMLRDALLENIHRAQLNPLEEAAAYQQLLDEFGVTHDELAARIGRSRPVITNMIRLMRLPIAVQRRVAAGVLSAGHARALLASRAGRSSRRNWRRGSSPRGCRCAPPRKRSRWPTATDAAPAAAPRRKPIQMPGLQDVAERLSTAFDTRVTVSLGKRKGKIVVEFGSVDDLQRIVDLMNVVEARDRPTRGNYVTVTQTAASGGRSPPIEGKSLCSNEIRSSAAIRRRIAGRNRARRGALFYPGVAAVRRQHRLRTRGV